MDRAQELKDFTLSVLNGLMANPYYHQPSVQQSLKSRGLSVENMAVQVAAIAMVEYEEFLKSAKKEKEPDGTSSVIQINQD